MDYFVSPMKVSPKKNKKNGREFSKHRDTATPPPNLRRNLSSGLNGEALYQEIGDPVMGFRLILDKK